MLEAFKAECDGAFSDAGISGDRVFLAQALQKNPATPYGVVQGGQENESDFAGDKDTSPVVIFPTLDIWSDDQVEANTIMGHLIERMTDEANIPTPTGWKVFNARVNFSIEISDRSSDGPDLFGRSGQFEIHLQPTN